MTRRPSTTLSSSCKIFPLGNRSHRGCRLSAASAYEKAGTFTNTYGDLQTGQKAGEITGQKSDFGIIVRLAERMAFDVRKLVSFGAGTRADMGQSAARIGEADRNAVWLEAQNLEPKLSPFDPTAALDEIQTLVPAIRSHA